MHSSGKPEDAIADYLRKQEDTIKELVRQVNELKREIADHEARLVTGGL
jgi:ribosomal protein L29